MYKYSEEHKLFLRNLKNKKLFINLFRILIITSFIIIWELLSRYKIINSFLFSSPVQVIKTLFNLINDKSLFLHIWVTLYELFISFGIGSSLGFVIALLFYRFSILKRIFDPYLTLLNSLPKVALGPLLIIWIGANTNSIIVMALLINLIVSIVSV